MVPSGSSSSQSLLPSSSLPSQHHTYLSLIVILILSEDDFFCKLIHETVSSFPERRVHACPNHEVKSIEVNVLALHSYSLLSTILYQNNVIIQIITLNLHFRWYQVWSGRSQIVHWEKSPSED